MPQTHLTWAEGRTGKADGKNNGYPDSVLRYEYTATSQQPYKPYSGKNETVTYTMIKANPQLAFHIIIIITIIIIIIIIQSALQPLVGFRPAQLSLSILSRKVFLQSAVASGTSNPHNFEENQGFRAFQLSPQEAPSF
jgi:hypothetical protein